MKPPGIQGKWVLFGAVVILSAIAAGALKVALQDRTATAKPAAKAVSTPTLYAGLEVSLPGLIQARHVVAVGAPIQGKVDMFLVEVGQEVYEGQLLAQIKSETLANEQDEAAQSLEKATSRVSNAEGAIVAARLEASRARADASRSGTEFERLNKIYQRQRMLVNEGATPRLVYQKAEKEYLAAKAEFDSLEAVARQAEDRVSSMQTELDGAHRTMQQKAEDLDNVKEQLAAGEVHSPVGGIVVSRHGELGGQVDPSFKDLFQIATDLSMLEISAEAGAPVMARLKPGQNAIIRVAEMPGEAIIGKVARLEQGKVIIEFGNPSPQIKPGLTAQVTIKLT